MSLLAHSSVAEQKSLLDVPDVRLPSFSAHRLGLHAAEKFLE